MKNAKEIHELYEVYCVEIQLNCEEPLDYDEWLEVMLILSDEENGELQQRMDLYQQAADLNHCHWKREAFKREMYEATLISLNLVLEQGRYDDAKTFICSHLVWN